MDVLHGPIAFTRSDERVLGVVSFREANAADLVRGLRVLLLGDSALVRFSREYLIDALVGLTSFIRAQLLNSEADPPKLNDISNLQLVLVVPAALTEVPDYESSVVFVDEGLALPGL